jgi:glycosyltransferase involved in cell wall biosynthesis
MGPTGLATAFSRVNARWRAGLEALGHTVCGGGDPCDEGACDVALVHDYSRPFDRPDLAPGPARVAVRTWDFGPFPARWARVVVEHYDELWVHSDWNRQLAIRGGVPPDLVRTVPLGVDLATFRPDGPTHPVTDGAATTFLFVGASVRRKGIDTLVDAYTSSFSADDDVQLVVKDHSGDVFYDGQTHGDRLVAAAGRNGPAIRYIDAQLDAEDLAAVYRGADALVLPYRAEGFAMTALEAMACGTAPVIPRFGAALDYTDEHTAWFTTARRISVPVDRSMTYNSLGLTEHVSEVDFCEPHPRALGDLLLRIADEPPESRAGRGRAAHEAACAWSWEASTGHAVARLRAVASGVDS